MSSTQAFGQYLTLTGSQALQFQNYWIGENVSYGGNTFSFLPFAFSGATTTKSGDNQPASLVFPNNALARGWAETAIQNQWLVTCQVMLINPDDKTNPTLLTSYTAQIVSGAWSDTGIEIRMASVLDAVGADIPRKKLTKQLVGNLPITSSVRLQ
jgi:hypothetical protein